MAIQRLIGNLRARDAHLSVKIGSPDGSYLSPLRGARGWLPLCVLVLSLSPLAARAGQYNAVLNIGDAAPAWKELPGVDGRRHSMEDLSDKELIVVVFTCNSCPYAVDYEDRLMELSRTCGGREGEVGVVAINVNRVEEDSLPAMIQRAKDKGFNFPYLYDESQAIARRYGAIRTPELFLLDKRRKIAYMGALDDSPDASQVQQRYLEQAIVAIRERRSPKVTETPPIGCAIRYVRERRQ